MGGSAALIARARSTIRARLAHLVAQLHQRRAACRHAAREIGEVVAAGHLRIDDGVNAQVDAHQLALPRRQRRAVEIVERVDDLDRETAGAARAPRRDFAGNPEHEKARRSRAPGIGLDRKAGGNQRRGGAAHGRYPAHQRMAVADTGVPAAIGHQVGRAGETGHGVVLAGIARARLRSARRLRARRTLPR